MGALIREGDHFVLPTESREEGEKAASLQARDVLDRTQPLPELCSERGEDQWRRTQKK